MKDELQEKTEKLIENLERLINEYEDETGLSITALRIHFDEGDCLKKVHMRTEYYNYEGALVRTPCDWAKN